MPELSKILSIFPHPDMPKVLGGRSPVLREMGTGVSDEVEQISELSTYYLARIVGELLQYRGEKEAGRKWSSWELTLISADSAHKIRLLLLKQGKKQPDQGDFTLIYNEQYFFDRGTKGKVMSVNGLESTAAQKRYRELLLSLLKDLKNDWVIVPAAT